MRNKKDNYFYIENRVNVVLDTKDVNDPNLDTIIHILSKNLKDFRVYYGDRDIITLTWDNQK